jgi:hypothetical protein
MIHFAVYDITTGAIGRHGTCASVDLALQAQAGEAVIETTGPAPGDRFAVNLALSPPALVSRPQ